MSKSVNNKTNKKLVHVLLTPAEELEMKEYNINCVNIPYYYYKSFRYTNLRDAIAQAKRDIKVDI